VPALLTDGLRQGGVPLAAISQAAMQEDGLAEILAAARPDDLVVLSLYQADWVSKRISEFTPGKLTVAGAAK
jgi:hypothetical protein